MIGLLAMNNMNVNANSGEELFLSIVIPVYNEADNLIQLYRKIKEVVINEGYSCQIIFVDDSSVDGSLQILRKIVAEDPEVEVIALRRNFGQTAAMSAGIDHSRGKYIITMDADLQNDPFDIPRLVKKMEEGFDVVSGWRRHRRDAFWLKKVPSWCANWLISKHSGNRIHDHGCTLKAYRSNAIKNLKLYGEQHRFIPALIYREGGKVAEIEVEHYPRKYGSSNYGLERVLKVLLDIFYLKFMSGYATRPLHFFGTFGIISLVAGTGVGIYVGFYRYIVGIPGINLIPLLVFCVLLILLGVLMLFIGLLAEISIRTYYESQGITTYSIDRIIKHTESKQKLS
jgi:glycosyltransferase involved in cell wall biosynthesis